LSDCNRYCNKIIFIESQTTKWDRAMHAKNYKTREEKKIHPGALEAAKTDNGSYTSR